MNPVHFLPAVGDQDHVEGQQHAPITLVEYGDYQCPYCGAAFPVVRAVQHAIGARLRFVFRNFPLSEIHPLALPAAEIAESVAVRGGAGAYWKLHALLFVHQREWAAADDVSALLDLASVTGIGVSEVQADLAAHTHEAKVRADFIGGVHSGVNGTPTFFINGRRHNGAWQDGALLAAIHAALQGQEAS